MSGKLKKIINEDHEFLFQNYGERLPVSFARGEGVYLFDQDNKPYLDFFSGIAVSNLGYDHPALNSALRSQLDKIIHTSNWFFNQEQNTAAKELSNLSFPGKTLFVNSGTEANEAAIKLARRFGLSFSSKKIDIITFSNSFHGRTMGSMTATAQKKIHSGFGPLPRGFSYTDFNEHKKALEKIEQSDSITAVLMELLQGEGGIIPADKTFVKKLRKICTKKKILLIIDEVQTGIGRTGTPFLFQQYDIIPDIITCAKGLGGGLPIGALHASTPLASFFPAGTHGSTFGGNHLACAAAAAVLKEIKKKSLLNNVIKTGQYIRDRLVKISKTCPCVKDVRGIGLHIGFELDHPGINLVRRALEQGLIINCTAEKVIRIMPPLVLSLKEAANGMDILESLLKSEGNNENTRG